MSQWSARTVAEDGEAVQQRHFDDEREQVVDDGVEELVRHLSPRHMRHALEPVVDVQLRAPALSPPASSRTQRPGASLEPP